MTRRALDPILIATFLAACDSGPAVGPAQDAGVDAPVVVEDSASVDATDAGAFAPGPYGLRPRDLAGPFTVMTMDGPWTFEEHFTGEDSYVFLTYAPRALVFSSGMAATATTLIGHLAAGDEVLCAAAIYGGTLHQIGRASCRERVSSPV